MILVIRESDRGIFEAIRDGNKTIETRAATTKFAGLQIGQALTFKCGQDRLDKTIKALRLYQTIEDCLLAEGIKNVMPGVDSLEEAKKFWHTIPGYEQKIADFGLIAMEFE